MVSRPSSPHRSRHFLPLRHGAWSLGFALTLTWLNAPCAWAFVPPDDNVCHAETVILEPTSNTVVPLLAPVTYHLLETYDSTCQTNLKLKYSSNFTCQSPTTRLSMMTRQTGVHRMQNDITVTCRYKKAGVFFSSPIEIEFLKDHVSALTLEPNVPVLKVELREHDEASTLAFRAFHPWHKRVSPIIWVAIIVFLLGIIVVIVIQVKHRKHLRNLVTLKTEDLIPEKPPIEIFRDKLSILLETNPEGEKEIKDYYDALSEAIRKYLSTRLNQPVMESTTRQLKNLLGEQLSEAQLDEITRILLECDLIKFARYETNSTKQLSVLRDASHLITTIDEALNASAETPETQSPTQTQAVVSAQSLLIPDNSVQENADFTPRNIYAANDASRILKFGQLENDLEGTRTTKRKLGTASKYDDAFTQQNYTVYDSPSGASDKHLHRSSWEAPKADDLHPGREAMISANPIRPDAVPLLNNPNATQRRMAHDSSQEKPITAVKSNDADQPRQSKPALRVPRRPSSEHLSSEGLLLTCRRDPVQGLSILSSDDRLDNVDYCPNSNEQTGVKSPVNPNPLNITPDDILPKDMI